MMRTNRILRKLGVLCAAVGLIVGLSERPASAFLWLGAPHPTEDPLYADPRIPVLGRYAGFVGTLAPVRQADPNDETASGEKYYVWAEYQPGKYVAVYRNTRGDVTDAVEMTEALEAQLASGQKVPFTKEYVPGPTSVIGLAQGPLQGAVVLSSQIVQEVLHTYTSLMTQWGGRIEVLSAEEFSDREGAGQLSPETTHVVAWRPDAPGAPGNPLIFEMPFDPRGVSLQPSTATVLVSKDASTRGQILRESPGQIAYLADYFSMGADGEGNSTFQGYFGHCSSRGFEETVTYPSGLSVQTGADLKRRFQRCDAPRIREVFSPVRGVGVSIAGAWHSPTSASSTDGAFLATYYYPQGYLSTTTAYAQLRTAPLDAKGSNPTYFTYRQTVVAGPTYQNGALGPVDTQALRFVNFGVHAAQIVAHAELTNEAPRALDDERRLSPGSGEPITIADVELDPESEGRTIYDEAPPYAPPAEMKLIHGKFQRHQDFAVDLVDRGLLKKISRGDLWNTDFYVYQADRYGRILEPGNQPLGAERRRLHQREVDGLVQQGGGWVIDVNANGGAPLPARFHPTFWVTHPGTGYYKLILVNRITGYIGSRLLTPMEVNGLPANITLGAFPENKPIPMYPPNLRISAKRVRKDAEVFDTVVTEGAGLTSDSYIELSFDWRDHDGTPLPSTLPGFSGRVSVVSEGKLAPLNGESADQIGHFNLSPGKNVEVIHLPTAGIPQHLYVHVNAQQMDRCDEPIEAALAAGLGWSAGCKDFEGVQEGALTGRPRNYVPFLVPLFDEEATQDRLRSAVETARATGEPILGAVDPVYRYVYRPEYQISLFDLEEPSEVNVVTDYDEELKGTKTALDFSAKLTSSTSDALPGWGTERALLWGVGYAEFLALVDGERHQLRCEPGLDREDCELDDLERLLAIQPTAQLGLVENVAELLTPADWLAVQLYQSSDPGNVLYDLELGTPLVQAEARPLHLKRRKIVSELDVERRLDDYEVIPLRLTQPGRVDAVVLHPAGAVLGEILSAQSFTEPGDHALIIDYQTLRALVPEPAPPAEKRRLDPATDPNFILEVRVRPIEAGDDGATQVTHRVRYPGLIEEDHEGEPVGQVVVHDVNLNDGSLRLSRLDFEFPGAGPSLSLARTYSNLDEGGAGIFGAGWSHSLDYRLSVVGTAEVSEGSTVPAWVEEHRGRLISAELLMRDPPKIHRVQVNGTTFTRLPGGDAASTEGWLPERGRFAQLRLDSNPCAGVTVDPEKPEGCFEFTARDGTVYRYREPLYQLGEDFVPLTARFSLSLRDRLALRVGLFDLRVSEEPVELELARRARGFPASRVESILDRFGQRLDFQYAGSAEARRLQSVIDRGPEEGVGDRSCVFDYDAAVSGCPESYEGTRLRQIRCLEGSVSSQVTVDFCYNTNGMLARARRGALWEEYAYEKQPPLPGEAACGEESSPKRTTPPRPTGGGSGGASSSGSGGSATDALRPLDAAAGSVGYDFRVSTGSGGTSGSGSGGSQTKPPEPCPFNLVAVTNELGQRTSFEYLPSGPARSDLGLVALREHPPAEMVSSITWPSTMGLQGELTARVEFDYTGSLRTVSALRPQDPAAQYTLSPEGHPVLIVEPRGKTTTQTWSEGLLRTKSVSGHQQGLVSTEYDYDERGNLSLEELSSGSRVETVWGAFGLPLTRRETRGSVSFDEMWEHTAEQGFTTLYVDRAGRSHEYTPDPRFPGLVGTEKIAGDALSEIITGHDDWGNPLTQTPVAAAESGTTTVRNARGEILRVSDGGGLVAEYEYDANGRRVREHFPAVTPGIPGVSVFSSLSTTYEGRNKKREQDRNGVVLTYTHTNRGQVLDVTRSASGEELPGKRSYTYDEAGNLTSETDWKSQRIEHSYDALGFRTQTKKRDGALVRQPLLDTFGNVLEHVDELGVTTQYSYDVLQRETARTRQCSDTACGEIRTAYDESSGIAHSSVRVTDEGGVITETHLDALGRVREVARAGAITRQEYDARGNVTKTVDAEGYCVEHRYDALNRLTWTLLDGRDCNGSGISLQRVYSPDGNLITERSWPHQTPSASLGSAGGGAAAETVRTYDAWDRVATELSPNTSTAATFGYDGEGNLVRQTDAAGNERTWERDALGRVLRYLDAAQGAGATTGAQEFGSCAATACYESYDANGNLLEIRDGRGVLSEFTYDAEDRVSSTREAAGLPVERTTNVSLRDGAGNPREVTEYGVSRSFTYNQRGLLASEAGPAGRSRALSYDVYGRLTTELISQGADTLTRKTTYDAHHRVDQVYYPDESSLEEDRDYDKAGLLVQVSNRRGAKTETAYDSWGRAAEVYVSGPGQVRLRTSLVSYNAAGRALTETDARGGVTRHEYDERGLPVLTVLPGSGGESERSITRTYSALGQVVSETAPTRAGESSYTTSYTYDAEGRVRSQTRAGETTSFTYDVLGNRLTETSPKAQGGVEGGAGSSQFAWDALGRLVSVVDPAGNTTSFTYDARGNLLSQTGPGSSATYGYDEHNNRTSHSQSVGSATRTTSYGSYDLLGNPRSLTDANGRSLSYSYDHYGRRTSAQYPTTSASLHEAVSISWSYDDDANRVSITETKTGGGGSTVDTTVVELDRTWDRPVEVTQRGVTVSYGYDESGNRSQVETPGGVTGYTYDAANRLTQVTTGLETTTYSYFPDGRLDTTQYPNGVTTTRSYAGTRRLQQITTSGGSGETVGVAYVYDANGNRIEQLEARGTTAETTTYEYDTADRLTRYDLGSELRAQYTYEGYNRKTESVVLGPVGEATTLHSRTYEYAGDELKQITEVGTAGPYTIEYEYDDNGNTISKEKSTEPNAQMHYAYDARDQLTQVTRGPPGAEVSLGSYDYNHAGLRVRARGGDRGAVDYYYDESAVIEERSPTGDLQARYHYGDAALRLDDYTAGIAQVRYYHQDALGTPTHLTDELGATVSAYQVDPWGRPRSSTNLTTTANRKLFTGHEYDGESGLYYAKARYYDPDSGRFLSQDSYLGEPGVPASLHRYLYVMGNPTRYVDPDGHVAVLALPWLIGAAKAALAGAGVGALGYILLSPEVANAPRLGEETVARRTPVEFAGDTTNFAAKFGVAAGLASFSGAGAAGLGWGRYGVAAVEGAAGMVGFRGAEDLERGELSSVGSYANDAMLGGTLGVGFSAVAQGFRAARGLLTAESRSARAPTVRQAESSPWSDGSAALRPGAVLEDRFAGSVGAARVQGLPELSLPAGRTILSNEVGSPLVRATERNLARRVPGQLSLYDAEFAAYQRLRMAAQQPAEGPIVFGQQTVNSRFSIDGAMQGRSIYQVARELELGLRSTSDFPVEYIQFNGQKITINNRSLTTLVSAGKVPERTRLMTAHQLRVRSLRDASNPDSPAAIWERIEQIGGSGKTEIGIRESKARDSGVSKVVKMK